MALPALIAAGDADRHYDSPYRHVLDPASDRLRSGDSVGYGIGRDDVRFAEVGALAAAVARAIAAAGVGLGEPVAVAGPPSVHFVAAVIGSLAAGVACTPLDHNLTRVELDAMCARAGIERSIAVPGSPLDGRGQIIPGEPTSSTLDDLRGADDDVAVVLHTSGSTGPPKAVQLTHRNLIQSLHSFVDVFGCDGSDRTCIAVPMFHVTGLVDQLLQMLWLGGYCRLLEQFSTDALLDSLVDDDITVMFAVPTVFALLARRGQTNAALPLRLAIYGGSPIGRPTFDALVDAVPGVRPVQGYGMTEMTSLATALPFDVAAHVPMSVGVPSPITQLRIIDDEGAECAPFSIGEILMRGPHRTPGYLANPVETERAIDACGWLHSGDLAWRDDDGLIHLAGRRTEIINRGGEKISPREIEAALCDVPGVAQAVAFAIPNDIFFEVPAAAIVVDGQHSVSEAEVQRALDDRLAPFKHPVALLRLMSMPLGANGKPDLGRLRAEVPR